VGGGESEREWERERERLGFDVKEKSLLHDSGPTPRPACAAIGRSGRGLGFGVGGWEGGRVDGFREQGLPPPPRTRQRGRGAIASS